MIHEFYKLHNLKEGDEIVFVKNGDYDYEIFPSRVFEKLKSSSSEEGELNADYEKQLAPAEYNNNDMEGSFSDDQINISVKSRKGQTSFRQKLMGAYQEKCCVTGTSVPIVLEAAHIEPHASETDYSIDNGLLLRADIHKLFDSGDLSVDEFYQVHISDRLLGTNYEGYSGKVLNLINSDNLRERLRVKHSNFLKMNA